MRNHKSAFKPKIPIYVPVSSSEVDFALAEYINNYPNRAKL